ncbi:hypothetical protein EMCRGX_G015053 [Ephydatia muelleri]
MLSPNADIFQLFDSSIPTSTTPNFEILGAPIGSPEFCGDYIEAKRKQACSLLHLLPQLCDPQVSILLLRHCASFCKLSHLSRSIPPWDSLLRQFMIFDEDVLHCLEECAAFELTHSATKQVQLPLRHGGLGLTSVSSHSSSAYISSLSNAIDVTSAPNSFHHLNEAIALYNMKIDSADALRDCFANLCSKACLSPQLEKGPGLDFSRPADYLVPNWSLSNPAAFDLKVIHPLNTDLILEASLASGNSAEFGEIGKHTKNDQMCGRLGWTCIPLVIEVYGGWGCEA